MRQSCRFTYYKFINYNMYYDVNRGDSHAPPIFLHLADSDDACRLQSSDTPENRSIEAVQIGDQRLSCDDLTAEMARMEAYVREGERVEAERQKGQATDTVSSTAAGSVIPFGGLIHLMAVNQPRNAEWINARERGGQAARRKEHLTALYNQRDCSASRPRS